MIYSIFLWRNGFRRDDHVSYFLLLLAFGLQTTSMVLRGIQLGHCPITNPYETTVFLLWAFVAVYLVVGLWPRLTFLGAFASPVMFAVGFFAWILRRALDVSHSARSELPPVWTSLHATVMSLAFGVLGLASVAALMYLVQERNLKFHKIRAIFSLLPPIQRLEAATGRLLLSGFILLTIGLAFGVYDLSHIHNPRAYRGDAAIVWSAVVWLLYLGMVIMRWKFARRGRGFARGAIDGFAFVLLTFWGVILLSKIHTP
jgi:ABC-type transport system involved in cytochrome c biogenesis permease subunit